MAWAALACQDALASGDALRVRLEEAATTTLSLARQAEAARPEDLRHLGIDPVAGKVFPRASHVKRHDELRPWCGSYRSGVDSGAPILPLGVDAADGPALRTLLHDPVPGVRAMAVEALAVLLDPGDIDRIGGLLDDGAAAPPILGSKQAMSAFPFASFPGTEEPDPLVLRRCWREATVADYARRALLLATGTDLENGAAYHAWRSRLGEPGQSLAHWQARLQHDADVLAAASAGESGALDARLAQWRKETSQELRRLPPEVEAKVLLLTAHSRAGGPDITEPERVFFRPVPSLRLPPSRLLDLLDRKDLWSDVTWDAEHYDRLVERLSLSAESPFRPGDAGRLRAVLQRERDELWWSGVAALSIAISRLLPGGKAADDPGTRGGYLRAGIRSEKDVFVRSYLGAELASADLPGQWAFLKETLLEEKPFAGAPNVGQAVIEELGKPPLSSAKRDALRDLLADGRFATFLTQPTGPALADRYRVAAARAIDAHAGSEAVSIQVIQDLGDPGRAAGALARLRRIGAAVLARSEK